jgi:hydroxymethylbilane synthase
MRTLKIATRESPLALWQAEHIRAQLQQVHPGLEVELLGMTTRADQWLQTPLAKIGGKGLFVKELEEAMLRGEADLAVHSMKDVPMDFPEGLKLETICEREDPRDAFVSNNFASFEELPEGAVLGTSSLRRQCQLMQIRPDLQVKSLRGNVNTRLRKLDEGEFDAIILASAGLQRLGFFSRITQYLETDICMPAGGQGAIGIEIRSEDDELAEILLPLAHSESTICVSAERAMNQHLNGGCQVPIAGYARLIGEGSDKVRLQGLVGDASGETILRAEAEGAVEDAVKIGVEVAEQLLQQGAGEILAAIYDQDGPQDS